ncbi:MAG: hypothetical protein NT164_07370 [Verrucomicrobiae bacterium]|nr:hypothetical protein [Verrucomicrobiae bacterium]
MKESIIPISSLVPAHPPSVTAENAALINSISRSSIAHDEGANWRDIDDSPEIKKLLENHPQLKQFLENLSAIPETLKENTDRLSEQLRPFITPLTTTPPESFFYLADDASLPVLLHSPSDTTSLSPTQEQAKGAAQRFFSGLKEFYGAELIDTILSVEQQEQSLTVKKTHEVLNKINEALQQTSVFLKDNPIIITPEYLAALATNLEAATAVKVSHQQLGEEAHSVVRNLREMGICGMILSGTKIGLAVAGVSTATPAFIVFALFAAALDGYIIGRLVTREEGLSPDLQHEAGTVSAVSTTGSATGVILNTLLQPVIAAYVPEVLSSTVLEYSGSAVALALKNAASGGVSTAEEYSPLDHMYHNGNDDVFVETRLIRFFALERQVKMLWMAIYSVVGLMPTSQSAAPSSSDHIA